MAAASPRWFYAIVQVKRALDETEPRWKQVFFDQVYLRFVRFCFFVLSIPPARVDENGVPAWVELKGGVIDRWRAQQQALKPGHSFQKLPLDTLLPDESSYRSEDQVFPLSAARLRYEQNEHPTVEFKQSDVSRLQDKITATDSLVARFRDAPTQ